jgi:hypothetical protein
VMYTTAVSALNRIFNNWINTFVERMTRPFRGIHHLDVPCVPDDDNEHACRKEHGVCRLQQPYHKDLAYISEIA